MSNTYNIVFKSIRMKNLATVGDTWLELNLDAKGTTLIHGANGAGKSSIALDAIMFALYNKPFKKIKIGELVNNINNKGMMVELTFVKGGKEYLIKRGYKPALFEVYVDGVMLDKTNTQQEYLEKNIITVPYNTFKQIVVMGKANYVSFLDLPKDKRREFVETILDMSIIRNMLDKHKLNVKENDNKLSYVNQAITQVKRQLEKIKEYIELHKKQKLEESEQEISQRQAEIDAQQEAIKDIDLSKYPSLENLQSEATDIKQQQAKVDNVKAKFEAKIDSLNQQSKFLSSHDNCPTCKQTINQDFKNTILSENQSEVNALMEKVCNLNKLSEDNLYKLSSLREEESSLNAVLLNINTAKNAILRLEQEIDSIKAKNANKGQKDEILEKYKSDLRELLAERNNLMQEYEVCQKQSRVNDAVSALLSDKGIKSVIINQYISQFNALANSYLKKFNLFATINFDAEFVDTIKKRGFDEYSYNQLSEGEKLRFDLSIMLAWREIASLKSNLSINLLVLDEIFNTSLDYDGCKDFINILHSKAGQSTIIVSPNVDEIMDLCSHKIALEKVNNFVRMIDNSQNASKE